jgi:hypothetical protein
MQRIPSVFYGVLIMLMVASGADAAAYMKFDGVKGESATQAREMAPGQVSDSSGATGTLPQPGPSANKDKPDEKKSCIKASHGDEAGTAGGVASGAAGSVKCATAIKVNLPAPKP